MFSHVLKQIHIIKPKVPVYKCKARPVRSRHLVRTYCCTDIDPYGF